MTSANRLMIRASIRGLLRVADGSLAKELRGVLKRDDDYASAGKPVCDWDDKAAREIETFERIKRSDAAQVEQRRREVQQFVVVLKNSPQPRAK